MTQVNFGICRSITSAAGSCSVPFSSEQGRPCPLDGAEIHRSPTSSLPTPARGGWASRRTLASPLLERLVRLRRWRMRRTRRRNHPATSGGQTTQGGWSTRSAPAKKSSTLSRRVQLAVDEMAPKDDDPYGNSKHRRPEWFTRRGAVSAAFPSCRRRRSQLRSRPGSTDSARLRAKALGADREGAAIVLGELHGRFLALRTAARRNRAAPPWQPPPCTFTHLRFEHRHRRSRLGLTYALPLVPPETGILTPLRRLVCRAS